MNEPMGSLDAASRIGERVPVSGLFASTSQTLKRLQNDGVDSGDIGVSSVKKIKPTEDESTKKRKDTNCFVCHKKGGEPLCTTCHRVYHSFCSEKCAPCEEIARSKSNGSTLENLDKIIETTVALLKEVDTEEFFQEPVDLEEYPDYLDVIVYPIDLSVMLNKAINGQYHSFESFLIDVDQLYHNCVVYNTTAAWVTTLATKLVRRADKAFKEVKRCPTCFLRTSCKDPEWFCRPCPDPHLILWAKVRSYPHWPAKLVDVSDGKVDVMFFGDHSRAKLKVSQCYLYGDGLFQMSSSVPRIGFESKVKSAVNELTEHFTKIKLVRRRLRVARKRISFDPGKVEHYKKLMFPSEDREEVLTDEEFFGSPPPSMSYLDSSTSETYFDCPTSMTAKITRPYPLKQCTVVVEKLPLSTAMKVLKKPRTKVTVPSRIDYEPLQFDVSMSEDTSPCITNVQTLISSAHSYSPPRTTIVLDDDDDDNDDVVDDRDHDSLIEVSPQRLTCYNNGVSSTSDANPSKESDFDVTLNDCFYVLTALTDEVASLESKKDEHCMEVSLVSNSQRVQRKDVGVQTCPEESKSLEDSPSRPKIAVRKDLIVPNNDNFCNIFLPTARSILEDFDLDKMSEYIVAAFDSVQDRDQLMRSILELNQKSTVAYANQLECMKANFEVERRAFNARLSMAQVLCSRSTQAGESVGAPPPPAADRTQQEISTKSSDGAGCSRCGVASIPYCCCPRGSYCSYTCQSEDWIRHSKVCQRFEDVQTNIQTVELSAGDNLTSRKKAQKSRRSPNGGLVALPSRHGNPNLMALPSTSSTLNSLNVPPSDPETSKNAKSARVRPGADSGGKLTMAARKMMPPNLTDLDNHSPSKQRSWKRANAEQGS